MASDWTAAFDIGDREASAVVTSEEPEVRRGVLRRLRENMARSRQALRQEISASLFDRIDEETWERLEEALILADVGAATTAKVVERLEGEVESLGLADGAAVRDRLIELLAEIAETGESRIDVSARPAVVMVCGVNGTG